MGTQIIKTMKSAAFMRANEFDMEIGGIVYEMKSSL